MKTITLALACCFFLAPRVSALTASEDNARLRRDIANWRGYVEKIVADLDAANKEVNVARDHENKALAATDALRAINAATVKQLVDVNVELADAKKGIAAQDRELFAEKRGRLWDKLTGFPVVLAIGVMIGLALSVAIRAGLFGLKLAAALK